jgi:hypothetical protein
MQIIKNKITVSSIFLFFYTTFVPILLFLLLHLLTLSLYNFFFVRFLKLLFLLLPTLIFLPFLMFSLHTNNIPLFSFYSSHSLFSHQFSSSFLPIHVLYHPDYFLFLFTASCHLCILYLFLSFPSICLLLLLIPLILLFLAYFPNFGKIKGSLWDHFAVCTFVCVPVCVCPSAYPPLIFEACVISLLSLCVTIIFFCAVHVVYRKVGY